MDWTLAVSLGMKALAFVQEEWPDIVVTVDDAKQFVTGLVQQYRGDAAPLTDAQRAELEAAIDAKHEEFQSPLPDEE